MIIPFIDKYTRSKVNTLGAFVARKYKDKMFTLRLVNPQMQGVADQYINNELKKGEEAYQKALKHFESQSWYNNYAQVVIPEVLALS